MKNLDQTGIWMIGFPGLKVRNIYRLVWSHNGLSVWELLDSTKQEMDLQDCAFYRSISMWGLEKCVGGQRLHSQFIILCFFPDKKWKINNSE